MQRLAAGGACCGALAESEPRLDSARLNGLMSRARGHADILEELRACAADDVIAALS